NGEEVVFGNYFQDLGDINFTDSSAQSVYRKIKEEVGSAIADGSKLLCLGGDHSISFPIIEAHTERFQPLHVLHIDAHPDLYENFEGNRYSHASPFARLMETGKITSLTQVGIRTLNDHQRRQATRYGIRIIEMKDLEFDFVASLQTPLYLSFDMDGLDPAFAPGVSHHEPGGLTTRQALQIIQSVPTLIGADIVEINPLRDINNMTAMVGYKLMKEIFCKF
ncbi:MAG: agmatinase, partial [Flammeovirgaceae bacterium]